jgi:hypothetical protein
MFAGANLGFRIRRKSGGFVLEGDVLPAKLAISMSIHRNVCTHKLERFFILKFAPSGLSPVMFADANPGFRIHRRIYRQIKLLR